MRTELPMSDVVAPLREISVSVHALIWVVSATVSASIRAPIQPFRNDAIPRGYREDQSALTR